MRYHRNLSNSSNGCKSRIDCQILNTIILVVLILFINMTVYKKLILEAIENNNRYYYMSEACGIFAIALHDIFGYSIEILTDSESGIVAHVYCVKNNTAVDFIGVRPRKNIIDYYHDINPSTKIIKKSELLTLMGDNDELPLMPFDKQSYDEARQIILQNQKKFTIPE